jgi:hypothetical protein
MDYSKHLDEIMWQGDFFRVLDKSVIRELENYINVMKVGARSDIWWNAIADYHVCDSFRTLSSLYDAILKKTAPIPIGLTKPPLALIECIYERLKTNSY